MLARLRVRPAECRSSFQLAQRVGFYPRERSHNIGGWITASDPVRDLFRVLLIPRHPIERRPAAAQVRRHSARHLQLVTQPCETRVFAKNGQLKVVALPGDQTRKIAALERLFELLCRA